MASVNIANKRLIAAVWQLSRTRVSASGARRKRKTPISEYRRAHEENQPERNIRYFILIAVLSAFIDQTSKALAIIFLIPSKSKSVIGDYLQLTLIRNRGAAFGISLGPNSDILLLIISAVAIFLIVYYYVQTSPDQFWQHISFGMITGGAAGNMIDRIAKGEVVDFIDCGIAELRWPIFNVADIAVTLGAVLLLKHAFVRAPHESSG